MTKSRSFNNIGCAWNWMGPWGSSLTSAVREHMKAALLLLRRLCTPEVTEKTGPQRKLSYAKDSAQTLWFISACESTAWDEGPEIHRWCLQNLWLLSMVCTPEHTCIFHSQVLLKHCLVWSSPQCITLTGTNQSCGVPPFVALPTLSLCLLLWTTLDYRTFCRSEKCHAQVSLLQKTGYVSQNGQVEVLD